MDYENETPNDLLDNCQIDIGSELKLDFLADDYLIRWTNPL